MKDERIPDMKIDISKIDKDKINSKEMQKKADEVLKQLNKEYEEKYKKEEKT